MDMINLILPILVGGFMGFYLSKSYKKRLETLLEMEKLALAINLGVANFKQPIADILEKFTFKTEVENAIQNEEYKNEYLTKEEATSLKNLLEELSYASSGIATQKVEMFLESLKIPLEKASEEYKKRGVMYQKLGLLFGLLVGILLW